VSVASLYYLGNARNPEQLADMQALEAAGVCIFCPQHLAADPNQRLLYRTDHWSVTPNEFPYKETRLHLLLVPDEHVTDLADLSPAAQQDFWVVLAWVKLHFGLSFYGIAARNGASEYTGGTVRHLHVHVVQGDVDDPDHQGVRAKLSSRPGSEVDPDQLHARGAQHPVPVEQGVRSGEETAP
jgi:diadenosine tetraphosphate (Ap4A) HIT family hydrolase